ncbi:MAG: hypothetical protein PHP21_03420, partial [Patescibacteria group bacterium]|nr:hypothetical protein [Patescibacteria group bacterium]
NEREKCPVVSIGEEVFPSHPKDFHHQVCSDCNQALRAQHFQVAATVVSIVGGIRLGKTTILPAEAQVVLVKRAKDILAEGAKSEAVVEILLSVGYSEYLANAVVFIASRERKIAAFKEALLSFLFHRYGEKFSEVKGEIGQLGISFSESDMHSYWIITQDALLEKAKKVIAKKIENLTVADLRPNDEEIVRDQIGNWSGILKVIFRGEAREKLADLRRQAEEEKRRQKEAARLEKLAAINARGKLAIRFLNSSTAEVPVLVCEDEIPLFPDNTVVALRLDGSNAGETRVIKIRKKPGGKFYSVEMPGATLLSSKPAGVGKSETKETTSSEIVWVVFKGKTMKVLVIPDPARVDQISLFGHHFVRISPNGDPVDLFQGGIGGFSQVGSCRKATTAEKRAAKNGEAVPA